MLNVSDLDLGER